MNESPDERFYIVMTLVMNFCSLDDLKFWCVVDCFTEPFVTALPKYTFVEGLDIVTEFWKVFAFRSAAYSASRLPFGYGSGDIYRCALS